MSSLACERRGIKWDHFKHFYAHSSVFYFSIWDSNFIAQFLISINFQLKPPLPEITSDGPTVISRSFTRFVISSFMSHNATMSTGTARRYRRRSLLSVAMVEIASIVNHLSSNPWWPSSSLLIRLCKPVLKHSILLIVYRACVTTLLSRKNKSLTFYHPINAPFLRKLILSDLYSYWIASIVYWPACRTCTLS